MKMLNGNVLTEVQESDNKTKSGIIIVGNDKVYKQVRVVEPDSDNIVAKDAHLYVPLHSGTPIEVDGKKYLVINVREIILIL